MHTEVGDGRKFFRKFCMSTSFTSDGERVRVQYLKTTFICGNKFYVMKFWMQKVVYMADK